MDEQLQRLIGELRKEQCPRGVLDEVSQRVWRESRARRWRYRFAWVFASVVVIGALGMWVWNWEGSRKGESITAELAVPVEADRTLVLQQTQGALVFIGHALLEAAAQTENALLTEAVPPLRNGLQTAKNKVTNPI